MLLLLRLFLFLLVVVVTGAVVSAADPIVASFILRIAWCSLECAVVICFQMISQIYSCLAFGTVSKRILWRNPRYPRGFHPAYQRRHQVRFEEALLFFSTYEPMTKSSKRNGPGGRRKIHSPTTITIHIILLIATPTMNRTTCNKQRSQWRCRIQLWVRARYTLYLTQHEIASEHAVSNELRQFRI